MQQNIEKEKEKEKERKEGTTIHISFETKEWLDVLKIHPREPYDDVLKRVRRRFEDASTSAKL
jgi:hypothetical protein